MEVNGTRRNAGFSLVEMILVGAIIGLSTYVVSVSFDTFVPQERLNTATRNVTAMLREARSLSIARNLEFLVEYDLDEERYRLLTPFTSEGLVFREGVDDEDLRTTSDWEELPDGVVFDAVYLTGERFDAGNVFVRFDPRGAATDHQVVLEQPKFENFYTIEILALTGLFRFHPGVWFREVPDEREFE